jgi:hypothetical protein
MVHTDVLTLTVVSLYVSKTPGAISVPVPEIHLRPEYGIVGDTHVGETQVRSTGEVVPNLRHFTAVNTRELGQVAEAFGVPFIDPAWIKANICFACPAIKHFTETLVEGTRLIDSQGRAVLEVKGVTEPCIDAGKTVAAQFPLHPAEAQYFPKAAHGHRGVYGIVLEESTIRLDETFTILLP